jgi:MbtH protein
MTTEPPRPDDLTIDGDVYRVLVNDEDQHSLWPAALAIPDGWTSVGPVGNKETCLAYVEANWTDLRPRSLREAMQRDADARNADATNPAQA